jgi:hypothetical protein
VLGGHWIWDKRYTTYDYQRSLGLVPLFDNSKIKQEFQINFRDIEVSLVATVQSLIDLGLFEKKSKGLLSKL